MNDSYAINFYSVKAFVYITPQCGECGEYHEAHMRSALVERIVKASDEKDALKIALQQERAARKDISEKLTLEGYTKPKIEFLRQETEAERMKLINAPTLEGFA